MNIENFEKENLKGKTKVIVIDQAGLKKEEITSDMPKYHAEALNKIATMFGAENKSVFPYEIGSKLEKEGLLSIIIRDGVFTSFIPDDLTEYQEQQLVSEAHEYSNYSFEYVKSTERGCFLKLEIFLKNINKMHKKNYIKVKKI